MNKGIAVAKGDWIIFINCGDFFYSDSVLHEVFIEKNINVNDADIIYGKSRMFYNNGEQFDQVAHHTIEQHWKGPVFRQGAMFVKTTIHKKELFLVEKTFRVSADYELMYRLHKKGYTFKHIDTLVLLYEKEGISDNGFKNIHDNYVIIKKHGDMNFFRWLYYKKQLFKQHLLHSFLYRFYKLVRK